MVEWRGISSRSFCQYVPLPLSAIIRGGFIGTAACVDRE